MPSVPLLPAPVKSVRDTAHAVKRLAGQAIQVVTEATLSQFLDLPEFRVLGYTLEKQGEVRIVHLYCEHRYEVALCPRCKSPSTKGHEYKERCVRDLDLMGRRTLCTLPVGALTVSSAGDPSPRSCPA